MRIWVQLSGGGSEMKNRWLSNMYAPRWTQSKGNIQASKFYLSHVDITCTTMSPAIHPLAPPSSNKGKKRKSFGRRRNQEESWYNDDILYYAAKTMYKEQVHNYL
ncbi:hypothetical protein PIB30_009471 [Stylosanthes scabra]|uniref:Uncharacterized protein n=1 Tax=Stylosanthes scabra TaxID=79078 RepID=A0ABU6Y4K7_9FABA|nr:hypothetical protein [Stylosanthes scabra]